MIVAVALVLGGVVTGAAIGEVRIGTAIGAALAMVLPWRVLGVPRPAGLAPAMGWRLVGIGIAAMAGVDALGELLDLPLLWRVEVPTALAAGPLAAGAWFGVIRPHIRARAPLDALLLALGAALLAWEWVWEPLFGGEEVPAVAGPMVGVLLAAVVVGALVLVGRRAGDAVPIEVALVLAAGGAYTLAIMLVDDRDLVMSSWSAVADIAGQLLAVGAVLLGRARATAPIADRGGIDRTARWLPAAFAVSALLLQVLTLLHRPHQQPPVESVITLALLGVLAARVGQVGAAWRRTRERLERVAHVDELTGLRNRAWLAATLLSELRAGHVAAAMMLDVDRFKLVNDGLGHDVGDRVLRELGQRLRRLRPGDEVVRLGGDEFLLLVRSRPVTDPLALAEAIRVDLGRPIDLRGYALRPTVSVGVAPASATTDPEVLLHRADTALYRAKATGRDRVVVFDAELHRAATRRRTIEEGLRRALEGPGFELRFQPLVQAGTGRLAGVEALLRWDCPSLGPVPPQELVGVAEELGVVVPLGRWVLDAACAAAARLTAAGLDVPVGVNVSPAQVQDPGFAEDVLAALRAHAVAADQLVVEVTEAVLLDEGGPGVRALRRLADAGVRIALDDFGTGYSALGYLPDAPLHLLKIDESFVARLGRSDRPSLIGPIVDMAHDLGLRVAAEGVETAAQRAAVEAMGCELLQGALLGAPVPLEELLASRPQPVAAVG